MPTLNDAFPLVALEAMAYGLPVITSEEGSLPDIIRDGETGILVEKGNVSALTERFNRCCATRTAGSGWEMPAGSATRRISHSPKWRKISPRRSIAASPIGAAGQGADGQWHAGPPRFV